jgi:hypothetical protein
VKRVVFLLEEYSMKVLLEGLLPRLFPDLPFLCVAHEGKQDLEVSIPRKLRAWREPGVRFVVIRDNDRFDCHKLKTHLQSLCKDAGCQNAVVRIACQELEAWYLGDPAALAQAYDDDVLRRIGDRARYRDPDSVPHPAAELQRLIPAFQKVSGARILAQRLTREDNTSNSFRVLMEAVDRLATEILSTL